MLRIKDIYNNFQGLSGRQLIVSGWIRSIRNGKQNSFAVLNDGSALQNLQLFFTEEFQKKEIRGLGIGSALGVSGFLQLTPTREQPFEIVVEKILHTSATSKDYPIQKKNLPVEFVRNYQHFRARTQYFLAAFRLRSSVSYLIHNFFQQEGFIYVSTPLITSNDAEGGGESFSLVQTNRKDNFFSTRASLTVSGQLQAEALAQGLGRVYNFSPCFRAENSNTTRHLAEFWMVEAEISFCDLTRLIGFIERMIKYIINGVLQASSGELQFFEKLEGRELSSGLQSLLNRQFKIISYSDCIKLLKKRTENPDSSLVEEVSWGVDLSSEQEKYITTHLGGPVFIRDYPSKLKAFYMKENQNEETVACVDLLLPLVGEVVGGSSREENYEKLFQRASLQKLDTKKLAWYFDLRKNGYSPSAGFGLGLERLLMFITGSRNIRDIIPFPRATGELQF